MKLAQLNTISAYSFSGSVIDIEKYARDAKAKGYYYIGINDNNIFNYPKLEKYALDNDLKPVFLYSIRIKLHDDFILNASLLIQNEEGYKNICHLTNLNKDLIEINDLDNKTDGLVLIVETSVDYEYKIFQDIIARELSKLRKLFNDNFYLGIGIYTKNDFDNINEILSFASTCSYKVIPFPKVLYLNKNDAYFYNVFTAAINKNKVDDFEKEGPYFLLSSQVLSKIYDEQFLIEEDKMLNSIDFTFYKKRGGLISFENDDLVLEEKIKKALGKNNLKTDEYINRANYELKIIKEMKFSSYFLLVEDYVSFAKNEKIKVGPSRGSAGGSLICFLLGITSIDPIKLNLSFERFLNPKRVTMPDIDIDFDSTKKDDVVQYIYNKYKKYDTQVSNIIAFSTLKPRSAIKLIAPILGYADNTISNLLDSISSTASNFEKAKTDPYYGDKFKSIIKGKKYDNLLKVANYYIGLPINTTIHASGIIVSNSSLLDCCHIIKKDSNTKVCSFEYETMEKLGFLKLDILSLKNLTFIQQIENNIINNSKNIPDINLDLDNKKVYDTLNQKLLYDIFQLDNSKIVSNYIDLVKPSSFKDLCELIDLIRPGAKDYVSLFAKRKNNNLKIDYLHPSLEPILKETYGIMIYQEQIMEVAKKIASFTLAEADLLRRAISKKSESEMKKYHDNFISGAISNGYSEDLAEKIYADIEKFSNYGFNKAHSYGYGLITYTLLYYKTFYPVEFYLSTLNDTIIGSDEYNEIMQELKYFNYDVGLVNINKSHYDHFVFEKSQFMLPLKIKGVNNDFAKVIFDRRNDKDYVSLVDFILRNKSELSKKENVDSLIKLIQGGYFDIIENKRNELEEKLSLYLNACNFYSSEEEINKFLNIKLEEKEEDLGLRLAKEKEALGIISSYRLEDKDNYKMLIVIDYDKNYDTLKTISNNKEFNFKLNKKMEINNYDFVMIKSNFNSKFRLKLIDDIQIIGPRRIKL